MKFRYVMAVYIAVWLIFIAVICVYEWGLLKQFQASYESEQKAYNEDLTTAPSDSKATGADNENVSKHLKKYTFTADSTMKVYLNGNEPKQLYREEIEDEIYNDISQLLGREIKKYIYTIEKSENDILEVKSSEGHNIDPVKNDFIKGICRHDQNIADKAVKSFEHYLKHIGGMVTLQEITEVMRHDSKAYKAVQNSQQSLKWMIKAKSIEFKREDVSNMRFFDRNHFSCDMSIDLVKTSDTEHERKTEETVNYTVLYENINGKWLIYSFVTK